MSSDKKGSLLFSTSNLPGFNLTNYNYTFTTATTNNDFTINNNNLYSNKLFIYQQQQTYSLNVNLNINNQIFTQEFSININKKNNPPYIESRDQYYIFENLPLNNYIGIITIYDDSLQTVSCSIINSTDYPFSINNNQLMLFTDIPLQAEDIANTVFYCATLPEHVCINDLTISCTEQANGIYSIKNI